MSGYWQAYTIFICLCCRLLGFNLFVVVLEVERMTRLIAIFRLNWREADEETFSDTYVRNSNNEAASGTAAEWKEVEDPCKHNQ